MEILTPWPAAQGPHKRGPCWHPCTTHGRCISQCLLPIYQKIPCNSFLRLCFFVCTPAVQVCNGDPDLVGDIVAFKEVVGSKFGRDKHEPVEYRLVLTFRFSSILQNEEFSPKSLEPRIPDRYRGRCRWNRFRPSDNEHPRWRGTFCNFSFVLVCVPD